MGTFVASGTFLTWMGTFSEFSFDTISLNDAVSQVSAYLKNNYELIVTDYDDTLDSDLGAGTVSLILQENMDRNSQDDIRSNVDDAFANVVKSAGGSLSEVGSTIWLNSTNVNNSSASAGAQYQFSFRNLLPSWLGGAVVTPEQQAAYTTEAQAQIQNVAKASAATTGAGSDIAGTAAATASQQSKAVAGDIANLSKMQNEDAANKDKWLLYGLIGAGVLVVAFVTFPYLKMAREVSA